MKIKILSDVCTICENKNSLHNYFAWPSIARLPDGALAMVCSGFRLAHLCPFGKAVICYSRDDGRTWTRPAPIIDTPLDDRDAGIAVNADGSVVILTSFNNSIKAQHEYSSLANRPESQNKYVDAYLNCLDSRKIERDFLGSTFVLSNDGGYTFGDIMKAPISCPHGPAVLPDGSFLYVGRCFTDDEASSHIQCFKISKTGQMQFVSTIENPSDFEGVVSCEPTAICLPACRKDRCAYPRTAQCQCRQTGYFYLISKRIGRRRQYLYKTAPDHWRTIRSTGPSAFAFFRGSALRIRASRKPFWYPRNSKPGLRKKLECRMRSF